MPWPVEDIEGDVPWSGIIPLLILFILVLLPMLQEKLEGGVGWLGSIQENDESS